MRTLATALVLIVVGCGPREGHGGGGLLRIHEADSLLAAGDPRGAVAILTQLAAAGSSVPRVYSLLAEGLWRERNYKQAVASFEKALRMNYSDYRTHMLFGEMLMEMGKTGRALAELAAAVRYGESRPETHYNYGLALYKSGRREQARDHWKRAMDLDPGNPDPAAALGMAYTGVDDSLALAYFRMAEEKGKEDPSFHHNFGLLLQRMGEYAGAEHHLLAAARADTSHQFTFDLASLYMKMGRYGSALPLWEELRTSGVKERRVAFYQGKCLYELGRYDEAVAALGELLSGPGADAEALALAALSRHAGGDLSDALKLMARSVELDPSDAVNRNNYGVFLAEAGRVEEALAQWRKVLEVDPAYRPARENIRRFSR